MRVPPTSRGDRFPPPSSRGGILSLRVRERIPGVAVATQEEALSTGKARGTPGSCHHPREPRCLRPFQGNLFSLHCIGFQAKDRLTPRCHVGQPCGKASWESLVGKPRGKASSESHRSFDPHDRNMTLLLLLWRKAHVHATTRDKD